MIKPDNPEIGNALLVSELKPRTVVWLQKQDRNITFTAWVVQITARWVQFRATGVEFIARRYGPDLQLLTDDSGLPIQTYEYLGEV